MGRMAWVAAQAEGRCQPRGTQQGCRAKSYWNHLGEWGEVAAGKASGEHVCKPHRKTRGIGKPWGQGVGDMG